VITGSDFCLVSNPWKLHLHGNLADFVLFLVLNFFFFFFSILECETATFEGHDSH
jgi:hypothetical protein